MPHKHSVEAHARRCQRAQERGYVQHKPCTGQSWVEVPSHLVDRVKVMTASLQQHRLHNIASGGSSHYARNAALTASLPADELSGVLDLHRRANKAKHSWPPPPSHKVLKPGSARDADASAEWDAPPRVAPMGSFPVRVSPPLSGYNVGQGKAFALAPDAAPPVGGLPASLAPAPLPSYLSGSPPSSGAASGMSGTPRILSASPVSWVYIAAAPVFSEAELTAAARDAAAGVLQQLTSGRCAPPQSALCARGPSRDVHASNGIGPPSTPVCVESTLGPDVTSRTSARWVDLADRMLRVKKHKISKNKAICLADEIVADADEAPRAAWTPMFHTAQVGSIVKVSQMDLTTISSVSVVAPTGYLGVLQKFDDDGDAQVIFPALGDEDLADQWVARSDFTHLEVLKTSATTATRRKASGPVGDGGSGCQT